MTELHFGIATMDEYSKQHQACPKCGSDNIVSTTCGYGQPDRNNAYCDCGWEGIVDELKPEQGEP